ncbi:MAG: hypothetical protein JWP12_1300 [Bacteroidetes bacterium]|nr:hypothetical protein [Bacteroidota bacterium]
MLIHQPVSAKDTSLTNSLFKDNLLVPAGPKPAIHYTNYDYAVSLVLFISFVVFVWLYVSNRKRLNLLVKGFYTSKSSNQLSRDEYTASNRMGLILSLLFLLTITLFVGQVSDYYGLVFPGGKVIGYGIIVLVLLLLYAVKIITVQLSGFVFKTGKETAEYVSTLFVFINLLGLFMLPVVMCLAFFRQVSPTIFIYTGYAIILGFVCIRLIRGIVIGFNSNRVSKFYLFLYLCTLEIIPFILIVKLFILYV